MTPHFPPFKSIYSQVYGKMRSEIVMVVFFYFLDWTSESKENLIIVRRWRGVMAMLITVALFTSDQRSQSLAMMEQISLSLLSIFIMMMVIDHCIYMKPMIPLQYPLSPPIIHKSGKRSTILEKRYTLRKKVSLTPKKVKMWAQKKSLVSKQPRYVHFAKKQVQFGQFWPREPHFWSTDGYRGSPPCAIFHNPDNREI